MKINVFSAIFALLVVLLSVAVSAHCQTQDGAVAIANTITPVAGSMVDNFATCVEKLAQMMEPEKAVKACKEATEVASKTAGNVSKSARKGVPDIRPFYGGYGRYGYGYGSYGYYPRRTVVVRQAAPPRPAAQPRPKASPRPAASPRSSRSR